MPWQIVTKQKYIPSRLLPDAALSTLGAKHDYIVLLDDNGNTLKEFHGKP